MTPERISTINQVKDLDNMTDLEKKHVPLIHIGGTPVAGEYFPVTVWVGEYLAHPSEAEHHIEFIDLYLDDKFITRCDLTWGSSKPKVTFNISIDGRGVLRAYERCNLHGDWAYSLAVEL